VLACLSTPSHAQSSPFGGEVALASRLVDRGLAITPGTPILQGALSWTSPDGWSLGAAGSAEVRSGEPVVALARASRAWAPSDDWLVQAGLLYYDYRAGSGTGFPDRVEANLAFSYRDIATFGVSAIHPFTGRGQRLLGAADANLSWPLTQRLSLVAGAGIAQASVRARYYRAGYRYRGRGQVRTQLYGYGNLGLGWAGGPWSLRLERNLASLDADRIYYGTGDAPGWVATVSRSF
jgi:uncharacterized protein (TIGR02001 family)